MALSDAPHDELLIESGMGRHGSKATPEQRTGCVKIQMLALVGAVAAVTFAAYGMTRVVCIPVWVISVRIYHALSNSPL
jgi:hypothetical protein